MQEVGCLGLNTHILWRFDQGYISMVLDCLPHYLFTCGIVRAKIVLSPVVGCGILSVVYGFGRVLSSIWQPASRKGKRSHDVGGSLYHIYTMCVYSTARYIIYV